MSCLNKLLFRIAVIMIARVYINLFNVCFIICLFVPLSAFVICTAQRFLVTRITKKMDKFSTKILEACALQQEMIIFWGHVKDGYTLLYT